MGGVGALGTFGGAPSLSSEFTITLGGKAFGLFGMKGFLLQGLNTCHPGRGYSVPLPDGVYGHDLPEMGVLGYTSEAGPHR